jgi:hypothetical protein
MPIQQVSIGESRQRESESLHDENSICNHDKAANTNQESSVLTGGRDDDLAMAETAGRAILTSFGRPKDTTMETYRDLKARVQLATAEAASKYSVVKEIAKKKNRRAERGLLTKMIDAAKQKHDVDWLFNKKIIVKSNSPCF